MPEPINLKINMMVTPTIWKYLLKKDNYSEYVRNLIEQDIKKQKRGKNKRLDL